MEEHLWVDFGTAPPSQHPFADPEVHFNVVSKRGFSPNTPWLKQYWQCRVFIQMLLSLGSACIQPPALNDSSVLPFQWQLQR